MDQLKQQVKTVIGSQHDKYLLINNVGYHHHLSAKGARLFLLVRTPIEGRKII